MKQAELIPAEDTPGTALSNVAHPASPNDATRLIEKALDQKVPVEALERLVTLHERISDRQAAQEFADALRSFQQECPPIHRASTTDYVTKQGTRVHYTYAPLKEIAKTVRPLLAKAGLSYTWDSRIDGGSITVVCTLRHVNGHSASASFTIPIEQTDRMSASQRTSGAATVARRQSLINVLGLTDTDDDDDGKPPTEPITDQQAADLRALIEEVKMSPARLFKYLGVTAVEQITQSAYSIAVRMIEEKRGAAR